MENVVASFFPHNIYIYIYIYTFLGNVVASFFTHNIYIHICIYLIGFPKKCLQHVCYRIDTQFFPC